MMIGSTPFAYQRDKGIPSEERRQKLSSSVSKGLTKKQENKMDHISESCKDLIRGLLQPDSSKRMSLQKLHYHPWIIGGPDESLHCPSSHSAYYVYAKNLSLSRLSQILGISKEDIKDHMAKNSYDSVTAMYYLILDYIIDGNQTVGTHYCNNENLSFLPFLKQSDKCHKITSESQSVNNDSVKEIMTDPFAKEKSSPAHVSLSTSSFESLINTQKNTNDEKTNSKEREERYMRELEAELEQDLGGDSNDSIDLTGIWNFDDLETESEKKTDVNQETKEKCVVDIEVRSNIQNRNNDSRNAMQIQGANMNEKNMNLSLDVVGQTDNGDSIDDIGNEFRNTYKNQVLTEGETTCDHSTSMIIGFSIPFEVDNGQEQHASKIHASQIKAEEKSCQVDTSSFSQTDIICKEAKVEQPVVPLQQETMVTETQNIAHSNAPSVSNLTHQESEKNCHTVKVPSFSTSISVTLPQIGDGPYSPVNEKVTSTKNDKKVGETVESCLHVSLPPGSDAHINHKLQSKRHRNNREPLLRITSYDINKQSNQIMHKPSFIRTLPTPRRVLSVSVCNPEPILCAAASGTSKESETLSEEKIIYSETARRILTKTPSLTQDNVMPNYTMAPKLPLGKHSKEYFTDRPNNIRPLKGLHVSETTEQVQRNYIKNIMHQPTSVKSKETAMTDTQKFLTSKSPRTRRERIFLTHASLGKLPKDSRLVALNNAVDAERSTSTHKVLRPKSMSVPRVYDTFSTALLSERKLSAYKPESLIKDKNLKLTEKSMEKKETKWDKKLYERTILDSESQIRRNEKVTSISLPKHFDSFRSLNSPFSECNQRNKIN